MPLGVARALVRKRATVTSSRTSILTPCLTCSCHPFGFTDLYRHVCSQEQTCNSYIGNVHRGYICLLRQRGQSNWTRNRTAGKPPSFHTQDAPMTPLPHADWGWRNICCNRCSNVVRCDDLSYGDDVNLSDHRLPASQVGAVIDRGYDFPSEVQESLNKYGDDMWLFRDRNDRETTRSRNTYRAGERSSVMRSCIRRTEADAIDPCRFEYITPRIQVTPSDFEGTKLERAQILHMISAPSRTADMLAEIDRVTGWRPQVIYEPVEYA
jgi:hypothetical protein